MGAPKAKTVGGGGAAPVADAFNKYLLETLNSGGFQGMMNGQNNPSPMSFNSTPDMNNPQFAAMSQYLANQQSQGLAAVNERYGGANARGTPGAFAQGNFLAQSGPQNVLAMNQVADNIRGQNRADYQVGQGNQEMMMRALMQAQGLGTPQAQTVMQPGAGSQFLGALSSLAPYALAPFTGGASLGIPGMMGAAGVGAGIGAAGKKMDGGGFSGGAGGIGAGGMPPMNPMMFGFGGMPGIPMLPPINPQWGR